MAFYNIGPEGAYSSNIGIGTTTNTGGLAGGLLGAATGYNQLGAFQNLANQMAQQGYQAYQYVNRSDPLDSMVYAMKKNNLKPYDEMPKRFVDRLRFEIDSWHGDILERAA